MGDTTSEMFGVKQEEPKELDAVTFRTRLEAAVHAKGLNGTLEGPTGEIGKIKYIFKASDSDVTFHFEFTNKMPFTQKLIDAAIEKVYSGIKVAKNAQP